MERRSGLTLIEVMIAIAVLAVGILAAAQLQAISLRFTAQAEAVNAVTRLVRSELEWQRQTAVDPTSTTCESLVGGNIESCEVTVEPCAIVFDPGAGGEPALICGAGVVPAAYRVTVDAVGARGVALSVSTIYTGVYVAGAAGGAGDDVLDGDGGDAGDEGGDDDAPIVDP